MWPSDDQEHAADAFGWDVYHDQQRNLVYYLHSYTGEVRWIHPSKAGFVMDGLKPLPVDHEDAHTQWSPYYPHVVMLPSGLTQVHPGYSMPPLCGYNRFPLPREIDVRGVQRFAHAAPEYRILPPTWEQSQHGSPFLPPYPVVILGATAAHSEFPVPVEIKIEQSELNAEARNAIKDQPKAIAEQAQLIGFPGPSSVDNREGFNHGIAGSSLNGKHCTAFSLVIEGKSDILRSQSSLQSSRRKSTTERVTAFARAAR